ncbi:DNA helicase [Pelagibius litoralis]|uniref:DNA helicase n=1 Tax=Pelagibius litoralis TaxID=374515 RepID=A0A967EYX6_9PROT|nr:DNA helicase [Pelagibius litoralis]NIA70001.1 DNA helicase [Pelagibius litoralis]
MRLSAPIYRLKRRAKVLSRAERIPLNEALDRVAVAEGFTSWSLLAARASATAPSRALLARLNPGDLVLLGARPGHGKTLMGLELIMEALKLGRRGVFFTLEYSENDVLDRLRSIGGDPAVFGDRFAFDTSDAISAGYIIDRLASAPQGSVAVVDYLQLLDQKRENPELMVQVRALKAFASARGLIIVFISQIDRSYDASARPCPDLKDVRLPNPLDLTLFNKTCFLNDGKVQIEALR